MTIPAPTKIDELYDDVFGCLIHILTGFFLAACSFLHTPKF